MAQRKHNIGRIVAGSLLAGLLAAIILVAIHGGLDAQNGWIPLQNELAKLSSSRSTASSRILNMRRLRRMRAMLAHRPRRSLTL